jgi:hypothetical protein
MRYTPMACIPNEMHDHEVYAHEIHAYEVILVSIISRGLCISYAS